MQISLQFAPLNVFLLTFQYLYHEIWNDFNVPIVTGFIFTFMHVNCIHCISSNFYTFIWYKCMTWSKITVHIALLEDKKYVCPVIEPWKSLRVLEVKLSWVSNCKTLSKKSIKTTCLSNSWIWPSQEFSFKMITVFVEWKSYTAISTVAKVGEKPLNQKLFDSVENN